MVLSTRSMDRLDEPNFVAGVFLSDIEIDREIGQLAIDGLHFPEGGVQEGLDLIEHQDSGNHPRRAVAADLEMFDPLEHDDQHQIPVERIAVVLGNRARFLDQGPHASGEMSAGIRAEMGERLGEPLLLAERLSEAAGEKLLQVVVSSGVNQVGEKDHQLVLGVVEFSHLPDQELAEMTGFNHVGIAMDWWEFLSCAAAPAYGWNRVAS